ncbi:MAG: Sulfotransferase domain protein [Candidatus Hydrogenedentes bacterium ADurb.Bin179]|nr:MAG: Sulfotransferase domain protein [Candidatus Hydrogenedentes bacterium ADurb.Bin179]
MGLGIKRRLRQQLVQFIRRRGNLLRELAATEEMKQTFTSSDTLLRDVLNSNQAHARIEESAFFEKRLSALLERETQAGSVYERVIQSLADKENVPKTLLQNPENLLRLFLKLLKDTPFAKSLFDAIEFQQASVQNNDFVKALIKTPEFQQASVKNNDFVKAMIKTSEVQQAAVESDTVQKRMLLAPGFQETALADDSFRAKIAGNEDLQKHIIRAVIKNALWQPSFSEALEAILRDGRLYPFVFENPNLTGRFVHEASKSDMVRQKLVLQEEMRREALAALLRGSLWEEPFAEQLALLVWNTKTQERILSDDKLLERLLNDDKAVIKTSTLPPVRMKLQLLRAREIAAGLPYLLPTIVLSYPRAGSNFLQSVLQGSTGMRCQSIYGKLAEGPDTTLTVKSHSPSPTYFEDEWHRFLPDRPLPSKIIRLQRDPRDVLISFIEYTETNRKTAIRQDEFLNEVDYFYASTIDRDFLRAHYKQGLTVAEAFKEHVRTWYTEPVPNCYEMLPVRYEDLLLEPQKTFKIIFDFLNLDCELAEKFLGVRVSLYSDTGRPRARIQGWRENMDRYGILLRQIREQLSEEIVALGYEAE